MIFVYNQISLDVHPGLTRSLDLECYPVIHMKSGAVMALNRLSKTDIVVEHIRQRQIGMFGANDDKHQSKQDHQISKPGFAAARSFCIRYMKMLNIHYKNC